MAHTFVHRICQNTYSPQSIPRCLHPRTNQLAAKDRQMVLKDVSACASGERHRMAASNCQVGYSSESFPPCHPHTHAYTHTHLPASLCQYQTHVATNSYRTLQSMFRERNVWIFHTHIIKLNRRLAFPQNYPRWCWKGRLDFCAPTEQKWEIKIWII